MRISSKAGIISSRVRGLMASRGAAGGTGDSRAGVTVSSKVSHRGEIDVDRFAWNRRYALALRYELRNGVLMRLR